MVLLWFLFSTTLDLKVLCHLLSELRCRTACSSYDKKCIKHIFSNDYLPSIILECYVEGGYSVNSLKVVTA